MVIPGWLVFLTRSSLLSKRWALFACIIIGLTAGVLIGHVTEYFTSYAYYPVKSITDAGITGPATVIIQGLGIGMISCVFPVLIIVAATLSCNALGGGYGVAISAVGMLSTLGVTLAADAFGPIADNAGKSMLSPKSQCEQCVGPSLTCCCFRCF